MFKTLVGSLVNAPVEQLNVNIGSQSNATSTNEVVSKIHSLLNAHKVTHPFLLQRVPSSWGWNLATLASEDRLLEAINPEVLKWFSSTFDLDREWLIGTTDRIQASIGGYKNLPRFFEDLFRLGWNSQNLKMTILAENYDQTARSLHRYAVVFSIPILEDETTDLSFYKHRLYSTVWDYHHDRCRFETKVVARWFAMSGKHIGAIPIIPVEPMVFGQAARGKTFIGNVWHSHGAFDRFEDRVLSNDESVCAIETDELPWIIEELSKLSVQ